MILPVLLFLVVLLVFFIIILVDRSVRNRQINYDDILRRKAFFVAEGGLQMALLKVALFPTECYDALAISRAKNPWCASDKPIDPRLNSPTYNPGPRYLARAAADRDGMLGDPAMVGTKDNPCGGVLNALIREFIVDLRYIKPGSTGKEKIPDSDDAEFEREEPFKHGFRPLNVRITAVSGDSAGGGTEKVRYAKESVELQIEGWIYDKEGKKRVEKVSRTVEITRTSK